MVTSCIADTVLPRSHERPKTIGHWPPAKNSEGNVPTLYAWRILDYWNWTKRPNPDDYQLRP